METWFNHLIMWNAGVFTLFDIFSFFETFMFMLCKYVLWYLSFYNSCVYNMMHTIVYILLIVNKHLVILFIKFLNYWQQWPSTIFTAFASLCFVLTIYPYDPLTCSRRKPLHQNFIYMKNIHLFQGSFRRPFSSQISEEEEKGNALVQWWVGCYGSWPWWQVVASFQHHHRRTLSKGRSLTCFFKTTGFFLVCVVNWINICWFGSR